VKDRWGLDKKNDRGGKENNERMKKERKRWGRG
jgi:hypothetical protein